MDLRSAIQEARERKIAIGHFNISDSTALTGIVRAAMKIMRETGQKLPLLIGVSEGECEFLGAAQAVALVRSVRTEHGCPIFLNADHTHSLKNAEQAAAAGFDAVLFDGSKLLPEENIAQTRAVAERLHEIRPDIVVEGELGYIGSSSALLKEIPAGAAVTEESLTTPDEARRFVEETGVDLFAPAVGNLHGMLANAPNPLLNVSRITAIAGAVSVPLVLHGGSGLRDQEFTDAVQAGVSIIHINTEVRVAWKNALAKTLAASGDEIAPYRILEPSVAAVAALVEKRLRLFWRL
ncbi:MAG: class II fructose-bisphosphate aldolase [Candidatus Liptonbacteria bacterium]|nr:class II fructose-bisphosphate aldolase [Candidatus Liptonbacteria bacterium]